MITTTQTSYPLNDTVRELVICGWEEPPGGVVILPTGGINWAAVVVRLRTVFMGRNEGMAFDEEPVDGVLYCRSSYWGDLEVLDAFPPPEPGDVSIILPPAWVEKLEESKLKIRFVRTNVGR